METKFFKKLLILTLLIYPLAAQAAGKRNADNVSNTNGPEQQETNKKAKKEYVCNECGKSLASKETLKEHKMNHESKRTDVYRFNCDECGNYKTNMPSQYKLHKANHESERTGVYEYNCDVCGNFKTNISWHYKLHQANHVSECTGEYKFNCLPCDFNSNTLGDFKMHEKTLNHKKNMALAGWAPLTVTAPAASTTINSNVPTAQEKFSEFLEFIGFDDSEELQVTELQEDVFELPLFETEDNNKPDWFGELGSDINNQLF